MHYKSNKSAWINLCKSIYWCIWITNFSVINDRIFQILKKTNVPSNFSKILELLLLIPGYLKQIFVHLKTHKSAWIDPSKLKKLFINELLQFCLTSFNIPKAQVSLTNFPLVSFGSQTTIKKLQNSLYKELHFRNFDNSNTRVFAIIRIDRNSNKEYRI